MKALSVKQAEKWLQKLKNANPNSYKELSKELRRYEKRSDQYQCFVKMNKTLLGHPDLTNDINGYLEEGNKFVVTLSEVDRINTLMKHIKKVKPEIYQQISNTIRNMTKDDNNQKQDSQVKDFVLHSVKGDQELEDYAARLLNFTAEDTINKLDLDHLKNNRQPLPQEEIISEEKTQPRKKVKTHVQPVVPQKIKEYPILRNKWPFSSFSSPAQEKNFIKSFDKKLKQKQFQELLKIINIYHLNLISKAQTIEFGKKIITNDEDFQYFTDIIQSRQTDRRRTSSFRPLIDFDYHNCERGTHSYVSMPMSYPILCSTRVGMAKQILNEKWISIPRGSEDFNVRSKNPYEQNLLKAEDERYEFDLYIRRLRKAESILNKMISDIALEPTRTFQKEIDTIISLGIIQLIYKNSNKDQKQELQWFLKKNTLEASRLFSDRVKSQIVQLEDIKKIHGYRNWNQIATKNWSKSQDFKGFAFKKNQKDKMKPNIFINELNLRLKYLECKGQLKALQTPFEDKKQFFSVFNSFQSSSRIERCMKRKTEPPKVYDLKQCKISTLLPVMILAFEDEQACSTTYSFISYYLENSGVAETQKIRCRNFFREVMSKFFKWKNFRFRQLSSTFDEEIFYSKVLGTEEEEVNLDEWVSEEAQAQNPIYEKIDELRLPNFNFYEDHPSEYIFQPPKSKQNQVFYSSEHFYVFLRFLYALYERIIRMKEVTESEEKIKLFQLLYYSSIKTKESAKFEDCLNCLFKNHAHIFSTIYKLMESLAKSLNTVSLCAITNESMKYMDIKCEEVYLLLLNRYYLSNSISNSKLMRFTFGLDDKLLYINSLESYYKADEQGKDLNKKRVQIAKDIETYTIEGLPEFKSKEVDNLTNGFEYSFEGNTIKMLNLFKNEDLVANKKEKLKKREMEVELKKSYDFWKSSK